MAPANSGKILCACATQMFSKTITKIGNEHLKVYRIKILKKVLYSISLDSLAMSDKTATIIQSVCF